MNSIFGYQLELERTFYTGLMTHLSKLDVGGNVLLGFPPRLYTSQLLKNTSSLILTQKCLN